MGKDPAFLFYSKDWLEGTAEMTSEEKGVYVDLLAHQHQKGSLPTETKKLAKLAGLSESEFLKVWSELSSKFVANASGRLVNRKLNGIVSERLDKGWRNTIIGTLGAIVRYAVQKDRKDSAVAEKVKKSFKVDDFLACPEQNLSERISEWFSERYIKCYESIANANNSISNKDENKVSNGEFEKTPMGSEFVKNIAKEVWEDKGWMESICMGQNIQPDELRRWMAQFNASVSNDNIPNFSSSAYKKIFLGWLNSQKSKGYSLSTKSVLASNTGAPPLKSL